MNASYKQSLKFSLRSNYKNLGDFLVHNAQKHKHRLAYQIKRGLRTQVFTFDDVHRLSVKTASFLLSKGVKKEDTVAIWAPNMPEYPILYFGCFLIGAVAVPIDVRTEEGTLKIFLTKARARFGFKGKFIPGNFDKKVAESFYLEDLVELVSRFPAIDPAQLKGVSLNDLAEIAFTSGTTGIPKGVMLTHGNFLSDVAALTAAFPFKKEYKALSLLPLSHAFEQVVDFLALFEAGITVTYLERINRLTILRAFRKNKITSAVLVPQALQLLMSGIEQEVQKQGKEKIWPLLNRIAKISPLWVRRILFHKVHQKFGGKLAFFGCGSAPLNVKLAQKWENLGIKVFEGYGATETTAALTINTSFAQKLGSVGKALPGITVRINPHTREIEASGPNISPGYFEDEDKTKAAFTNGWYKTGDVGQIDTNGFLYITGRESFRIVLPNGQKVYPEDIEKKLDAHPLVISSCVVGLKEEEGEVVCALVITRHPQKLDQIIADVNQKLSSHEQIMEWRLWQGDDFPRTPLLKLDRRKIAESIKSGLQTAQEEKAAKTIGGIKTQDPLVVLLSKITRVPVHKINDTTVLSSNLKMDSLQRVELLSAIEQEFAVAIPETAINPKTSVGQLRKLIKESPATEEEIAISNLNYSPFLFAVRLLLQYVLMFPLHSLFVPMKVSGREHLEKLKRPAIFYYNHVGIMDGVCVLRVLPKDIRGKLVIAVKADIWKEWRRFFVETLGGGFPFDNRQKVKASLELTGEFLDKGYSLLIAPEGKLEKGGKMLQFKPGIGFLALAMQTPVVPVKIDPSYAEIFPPIHGSFLENIPKKRRRIVVTIGKPIEFKKGTDFDEATTIMQEALELL